MMIGLQYGLIVEGLAREGFTIYMVSGKLHFYWSQVEYCVEPPPEPEEEDDENDNADQADPFVNDNSLIDFNRKVKKSNKL